MSQQTRARGNAPWVAAAVLTVVVALLALALVRVRAVADDNDRNAGTAAGPTSDQLEAVQAGATEAANLTTLTRKNYSGDFARALAGASGNLRKDLLAHKKSYLSAMTSGKFDLKATVVESAFEADSAGKVTMLVTLNGTHVVDGQPNSVASVQRLELTMVSAGGKWLATDFTSVGVQ